MIIDPKSPLYVLLNVKSGKKNSAEEKEVLEKVLAGANRNYEIILIDQPDTLIPRAEETIQKAVNSKGIVVIGGGDGAISSVAQLAWNSDCPLGLLPQGTFNYFCRNHQIPEDIEQAARLLIEGAIQPVSVGLLNDRLFLVNASLGLYPDLLETRRM